MPHRPLSSASLRSHFVPRVYLRAWADEAGRLAVRRRSETVAALRHVGIIGVDRGLYGTGPSAEARERMFGQIESAWLATRPALIDAGGLLPRGERDAAAVFIAMQMARTREKLIQIEFVSDFARFDAQRPVERESVRRYLRERHLRADPSDQEVEGAWTVLRALLNGGGAPPSKDEIMGNLMNAAVREVAPRLGAMRWTLERCRKPSLLTSDRPAMCWRPPSFRDAFEGIGIENAVEVRVPVAPRHLLVLRHAGLNTGIVDVAPARFTDVNTAIASQCFEFVAATAVRQASLTAMPLVRQRPALRFNVGPGVERLTDGSERPMGGIVPMWTPVRAVTPTRRSRPRGGRP